MDCREKVSHRNFAPAGDIWIRQIASAVRDTTVANSKGFVPFKESRILQCFSLKLDNES
eukprot:m.169503 g.169503  ORF g.169503 m.169503 type:complete len:59 (+) comp18244_c0_seq4:1634-1810(+)